MIKEAAVHFVEALREKTSLSPLYEKRDLVIEIQSSDDPLWLSISKQGHYLLEQPPLNSPSLTLSAKDKAMLVCVLTGERPLLTMKEEGYVTVQGPFNDQLSLESLLILSSHHSFLIV